MSTQSKENTNIQKVEIDNEPAAHVHGPNCQHDHHHAALKPILRNAPKVGRNDPCSCGSQKKFKKCCGN